MNSRRSSGGGHLEESTDDEDIILVKEIGPVANIDFPHPRSSCSIFPFFEDGCPLNVRHCIQCYCFICDVKASKCKEWGSDRGDDPAAHCHAFSNESWEERRREQKASGSKTARNAQSWHLPQVNSPKESGMNHNPMCSPMSGAESTSDMSTGSPEATDVHPWTPNAQLENTYHSHMAQAQSEPYSYHSVYHTSPHDILQQSRMRSPGGAYMQLPHPRDDLRLGLLGSIQINCKVDNVAQHRLVPVGFWDVMTQNEIIETCYEHNMISLWNLHLFIDFESIVDIQCPGADPVETCRSLIMELQKNTLGVDDGFGKRVPKMYVHLESKQGSSATDRELHMTVYLWRIGQQWCLLGNPSLSWQSCQSIETLMMWLSFQGSWGNNHRVEKMHEDMMRWRRAIQTPVLRKDIPNYLKLMSHDINSTVSSEQSPRLKVNLHAYQLHSIEQMHLAESQEIGFTHQFWAMLDLEGQPFWYSPFLKLVCIEHPYPQCRGGFLADSASDQTFYTVLGLVLAHPCPIPCVDSPESRESAPQGSTRATLVVCATREAKRWLALWRAASKPFSIVAYEDTEEFWASVDQRDMVVVTYAEVTKEYRSLTITNPSKRLFETLWHRLVFANGSILSPTDISPEMRLACAALGSNIRWIIMKEPITENPWDLQPKLQVLRIAPWGENAYFEDMLKEKWRPYYLLSQLIIRHEKMVDSCQE